MSAVAVERPSSSEAIKSLFPDQNILSPSGYLSAVRKGLSGDQLRVITDVLGSRELVARTIGKEVSNLSRSYRVKVLPESTTDSIIGTLRVYMQAVDIYQSEELAQEWLNSPIPALGGEVPSKLLNTDAGRELVRQTLHKMAYGEYV